MTAADLNCFLLRALRAKPVMTEAELVLSAQKVFGREDCPTGTVIARLRDLEDKQLVTTESDPDGVNPATWALTVKGQHKAKTL